MLGIEENNQIDIKYLTKALRDAIYKHPEGKNITKLLLKTFTLWKNFKRECVRNTKSWQTA